jgi:ribosome assembly protein YihI (activator of Der GTPase)
LREYDHTKELVLRAQERRIDLNQRREGLGSGPRTEVYGRREKQESQQEEDSRLPPKKQIGIRLRFTVLSLVQNFFPIFPFSVIRKSPA